jgi:hypothetical protein
METTICLQTADVTPPQVFISSTFEDRLQEIRVQIQSELEAVNYLPVMSELGSFSYTHHDPVYDDTVAAVSACQIYVLIIGRRYGTVHPGRGCSITELEYLEARDSGLPIFVYIQDSVWEGYQAHRAGAIQPGAHTHWVDQTEVFTFIERVADADACRCVPFQQAPAILTDLKRQLANLLGGYLRFQAKAAGWLWTEQYTRLIEREADLVWVLTPNFYWDYLDAEFRQIVFANVTQRNAKYFYVFKEGDTNRARINEMVRDYASEVGESWKESVHYAAVPEKEFNWCTEQALFNPGDPKRERGILVDGMDGRNKEDKYNVELGRDKLVDFRRQFQRLWSMYGEGALAVLSM